MYQSVIFHAGHTTYLPHFTNSFALQSLVSIFYRQALTLYYKHEYITRGTFIDIMSSLVDARPRDHDLSS